MTSHDLNTRTTSMNTHCHVPKWVYTFSLKKKKSGFIKLSLVKEHKLRKVVAVLRLQPNPPAFNNIDYKREQGFKLSNIAHMPNWQEKKIR